MEHNFWDHNKRMYIGPHKPEVVKKVDGIKQPYHAFYNQKRRTGVKYKLRALIYWYYFHPLRKKLKYPNIGRLDHSKLYDFDNIILQEQTENVQERNLRCGNPKPKGTKWK